MAGGAATGPSLEEMQDRIGRDARHFGARLPKRHAIAWHGYLAALIEWGLISTDDHARLTKLLPQIASGPIEAILLGHPDDEQPQGR